MSNRVSLTSLGEGTSLALFAHAYWGSFSVMLPIEVCVPTAISGSVDISKALEVIYYDRLVLKELLQRLVSHKLTAYLSVLNLFLT